MPKVDVRGDVAARHRRDGETLAEVGRRFGVSGERVRRILLAAGFDTSGHRPGTQASCTQCGATFEPYELIGRTIGDSAITYTVDDPSRRHIRFCSPGCLARAWHH